MVVKVIKTQDEWRRQLTPEQFRVTRLKLTERPGFGQFGKTGKKGLYRCVCCGQGLFSSADKYDSHTGWPSFSEPLTPESVLEQEDQRLIMHHTEVLCSQCDAHLGHVFADGPMPSGLRYCINSASLKFEEDKP